MFKKGQAAMEFLMTYGWAILVVLVAIGALAYFGVLSPDKFLPSKCVMPSGVACLDHRATTSQITLVLQNSLGYGMSSVALTVNGCGSTSSPSTLANGAKGTYNITCGSALTSGAKFSGDITFN
ncbi:hypothetical protein HYU07_05670, partial [Candidatus Woesearchaeota archaeon]|nr:hypothetical protein [Candidatus Woesearchaeota archaeon]